jgi:hypothetical protein
MLKIIYHTFSCLALVLAGEVAAESQEQEITYTVLIQIPTVKFYVYPINYELFSQNNNLHWNILTAQFSPFLTYLKVRNTFGGITAKLTSATPQLENGFDKQHSLPVEVKINSIIINNNPKLIVDRSTALHETRIPLEIRVDSAKRPPGQYWGSIGIIFESETP